jgi:multisubunit Na+/H+ antiporter MnhC subunit
MEIYLLAFALFCIGLYGMVRKRNLIKMIIGLAIMEYAVNLFLVLIGYRMRGRAPILANDQQISNMVDPLAQAMVLTTIVIGLAVILLAVAIAVRIYEKYGTFEITKIKKLKG